MSKTLALAAAATLALVAVGAPSDANAQWRRGPAAAGILGGLAAGAIIGGALAGPRYYEPAPAYGYPAYGYYEAPPASCVEPQWVWSNRRGEYVWRNIRVPC